MSASLTSIANDTKWDELRLTMFALSPHTKFRCQDLKGYYSEPDGEWYYHFREGGYDTIRYTDIIVSHDQRAIVLTALQAIGLAGRSIDEGFRVYGYIEAGQAIEYF